MRKTVSGSPLYYSPEIVQETSYDEKIDIWAIGMMTYECLLGKIPFKIYSELDLGRIVIFLRYRFQMRCNFLTTLMSVLRRKTLSLRS